MPAVLQIHIGDQHADASDAVGRDQDWLDGSIMQVWSEFRALLQAGENLCGSVQHPERGAAFGMPQFADLCLNWFALRRRGRNVIVPSVGALDDWWGKAERLTAGNPLGKRFLRENYISFDPALWGRHTDKTRFLYVTLDRDVTIEESDVWSGKHTSFAMGDKREHNPKWVNYLDDLVVPKHIRKKRSHKDSFDDGSLADIRDPNFIIDVSIGQPDIIIRTRNRETDGSVKSPNRINAKPVRMIKQ